MAQVPAGGDLHDHDHDHAGHDHAGHDRAAHGDHDHAAQTRDAREHAGHDHAGHNHAGHNHAGHNHAGHNHAGHSHAGHHHAPTSFGKSFAIATVLNSAFVVIEFFYGFATHSTALMADAGHNLSDVLGLLLAWGAAVLASKTPTARYTYGFRRTTILAAIANAMLLLVSCGAIAWVALDRLFAPVAVLGETVSIVAAIGILINGGSALLFMSGSKSDLNVRGAYLHMAADAAVSLGVVVAGLIMLATGWFWIDPVVSLVIVAVIVAGTWGLLRDSICLGLDAVPPHIDQTSVRSYLRNLAGVADIHDLHIWGMSTTETALTAHLVMPSGSPGDQFLSQICASISRNFGISHVTIQIENGTVPCELAPDHVV